MAEVSRAYVVRDAGTAGRPGKIRNTYPYSLRDLLQALEDARLRSLTSGPQVVAVVTGR